jgi:methyltransferase family protein
MIVASVNAKKRLAAVAARERFGLWLERREVTLVVVQEGWRAGAPVPPPPPGMQFLEGDAELAAWIRAGIRRPRADRPEDWWQTVFVGGLAIHSLHLDPYSAARRVEQLQVLAARLPTGDNVVLGDFNLAPRLVDGIYGTSPSRFTSGGERRAFAELLAVRELADATACDPPEFTLSRRIRRSEASFRCDLALLPASWPTASVMAAHETRTGSNAFTDHSGIIVRVSTVADRPVGRPVGQANRRRQRSVPPGGVPADPRTAASFKTAIARRRPSAPATVITPLIERVLAESPSDPSVRDILDYGCGRGTDVEYFRRLGMDADGYDPHVPFGFAESPTALFRVVTLIFVLNVLPTMEARLEALRGAAARLALDSVLIVATRSSTAVRHEAARSGWRAWGDGFVSHEGRGTFQHGMGAEEIVGLGEMLGLQSQWPLPAVRDASLAALTRRQP